VITAGVDIGSITTKAAIIRDGTLLGCRVGFTGYHAETSGQRVLEELLRELALDRASIHKIIATGYGRNSLKLADSAVTEITCHAVGAHHLNPHIRSIVDIGGQDSKAIALDERGKVRDFVMNDKCAAGTGRFLEVMARALEVDLENFGPLSLEAEQPSKISSLCTVFAESEVISLISRGEERKNIIAGIHESIAARVASMARRVSVTMPLMMTGGVAKNIGVVRCLEKKLECPIEVSLYAQENGAIGAAVLAAGLQ
jgi:(R)-2-hydroxyacyl-CoA dehydratese activating ATPase